MTDLRELYQEIILEHNKSPRNFRRIENAREVEGYNPLCGDHYTVFLTIDGDTISDVAFQGAGCAISKASASVMTQVLKGKSVVEAEAAFHGFRQMVTGEPVDEANLGKLAAFAGVKEHPSRVKCAILAWHAMNNGIHGQDAPAKTE